MLRDETFNCVWSLSYELDQNKMVRRSGIQTGSKYINKRKTEKNFLLVQPLHENNIRLCPRFITKVINLYCSSVWIIHSHTRVQKNRGRNYNFFIDNDICNSTQSLRCSTTIHIVVPWTMICRISLVGYYSYLSAITQIIGVLEPWTCK